MKLFATKPIETLLAEAEGEETLKLRGRIPASA